MATYYGKNGILRVYDSTAGADLSQSGPKQIHVSNEVSSSHNDVTANMLDPDAGTETILAVNTDRIYIGQVFEFSKVRITLESVASADGGALVVEYWNGSWTAVGTLVDGTAVGANTMQDDGVVSWDIPTDWVKNDPALTGTSLYYVRMRSTTSIGTDPVARVIEPISGQFVTVIFSEMNLTGPFGRGRPEEILRLNRGQLDFNAHYVQGLDDPIEAPVRVTWSCLLESGVNKNALLDAIQCKNANLTDSWPLTGISTKTDSSLPSGLTGVLYRTPPFTDPSKKAVCVQGMWDDRTGSRIFRQWHEAYFDPQAQTINEAPDRVTINLSADIYGAIDDNIMALGYELPYVFLSGTYTTKTGSLVIAGQVPQIQVS